MIVIITVVTGLLQHQESYCIVRLARNYRCICIPDAVDAMESQLGHITHASLRT